MIAYSSRTGNVKFIVSQLQLPSVEITEGLIINKNFILFTYTDGLGQVPKIVSDFLKENYKYCKGVIASGNSNFGNELFCKSAKVISDLYNIPIIHKIELRGFKQDYEKIKVEYNKLIKGD